MDKDTLAHHESESCPMCNEGKVYCPHCGHWSDKKNTKPVVVRGDLNDLRSTLGGLMDDIHSLENRINSLNRKLIEQGV